MELIEAILVSENKIELQSKKLRKLNDNELLIKVIACGLCSSEFPVIKGEVQGVRGASFRYAKYPSYLGHEVTGIVLDYGAKVSNFAVGDRVTGIAYEGSGFATHVISPSEMMIKVPEHIPLEYALGEPLMAVLNAVRMAGPDFGDSVFLVGDGFMSLLTVAMLKEYPLKNIIISGHHQSRLNIAKNLGATKIINSKFEDPYWETRKIIDGANFDEELTLWKGGVDIAFEYAGKMSTLQLCASLCKAKKNAKLMMTSFYSPEDFTLGHYLINRAPCLIPSFPAHSRDPFDDLDRATWALGENLLFMEKLITHSFELENINMALDYAYSRKDSYIKGIITPNFKDLESNIKKIK